MFQFIAVCDSFGHFEEPISQYVARLGKDLRIIRIRPEKSGNPDMIVRKESLRILDAASKEKGLVIGLEVAGASVATERFSEMLASSLHTHPKITFVLGGAYGYDAQMLSPVISRRMSLSEMTLPHQLAFLVLIEQLYRVRSIWRGAGYHH